MRFYLFISAFLGLFGAFTLVFIIVSITKTPVFSISLTLLLSGFFIFSLYKVWQDLQSSKLHNIQYSKKLQVVDTRIKILEEKPVEHFDAIMTQIERPAMEIQGLLASILSGTQGKLNIKIKNLVKILSTKNASIIETLQKHILATQLENNTIKIEKTDFNLKDLSSQLTDEYRKSATQKGLVLSFKSDTETKTIVNADNHKTTILLAELIENALKFTTRGTVTVFVHDDKKQKKVHVDIVDSGIGLEESQNLNIFKKFHKGEPAITMQTPGVGLGLHTAQLLAKKFNGSLTAYSDGVGHGTTIRLTLPIEM
jgi:signal transduction histidine kinase